MPNVEFVLHGSDDASSPGALGLAKVAWPGVLDAARPGILQYTDVRSTAATQYFVSALESIDSGHMGAHQATRHRGPAASWTQSLFLSGLMTYQRPPDTVLPPLQVHSQVASQGLSAWQVPVFLEISAGVGLLAEGGARSGESATEALRAFRALMSASGIQREQRFKAMLRLASPRQVYDAAKREYDSSGGEVRLALAASALAEYGERAMVVLREIAADSSETVEYFVYSAANLRGVSREQRAQLVARFLQSPHVDVKSRALEALESLSDS